MLAGAAGFAALIATYLFKPGTTPLFIPCPLYSTTGIHCPGCGATRALHALTHGELATALHNNLLLVVALPLMAYAWVAWLSNRFGSTALPVPQFGERTAWAIVVIVGTFWIVRNIDIAPLNLLTPIPV